MHETFESLMETLAMTDISEFETFEERTENQIEFLKNEIVRIKKEIAPKLNEIDSLMRKLDTLESYLAIAKHEGSNKEGRLSKLIKSNGETIGGMAVEILKEVGKPTHYKDIMAKIDARFNFKIPGKKPASNMTAHLTNDERILITGRGIYALKEWSVCQDNFWSHVSKEKEEGQDDHSSL